MQAGRIGRVDWGSPACANNCRQRGRLYKQLWEEIYGSNVGITGIVETLGQHAYMSMKPV